MNKIAACLVALSTVLCLATEEDIDDRLRDIQETIEEAERLSPKEWPALEEMQLSNSLEEAIAELEASLNILRIVDEPVVLEMEIDYDHLSQMYERAMEAANHPWLANHSSQGSSSNRNMPGPVGLTSSKAFLTQDAGVRVPGAIDLQGYRKPRLEEYRGSRLDNSERPGPLSSLSLTDIGKKVSPSSDLTISNKRFGRNLAELLGNLNKNKS